MAVNHDLDRLIHQLSIEITERAEGEISRVEERPLRPVMVVHPADQQRVPASTACIELVSNPGEDDFRRAAASGSSVVIDPVVGMERVLGASVASACGFYPLPDERVSNMVSRLAKPPEGLAIQLPDVVALRALSNGAKVGDLARLWSVSERHARRHATALQQMLAATTHTEAVANALRWGLL